MKNLPLSLALAAVSGAFTLSRPADWSPGLRRAYILVPGAAIGAIGVVAVRKGSRKGRELAAAGTVDLVTPFTAGAGGGAGGSKPASGTGSDTMPSYVAARTPGTEARMPAIGLAGLAAIIGVTVSGVLAVSLVLDEAVEAWLVRRGATRPRQVMAVAAALSSLVLDQVMDSKDAKDSKPGQ